MKDTDGQSVYTQVYVDTHTRLGGCLYDYDSRLLRTPETTTPFSVRE